MNEQVLLTFDLELYRAPRILAHYLLTSIEVEEIQKKLAQNPTREYYLGELEGKHSETRFTGVELLSNIKKISDSNKIKAFQELYDSKKHVSFDILEGLNETWVND